MAAKQELNGTGKQKCTKCSLQSISGLMKGRGYCPFHYADLTWGKEWASKCYPEHKEAIK